MDLTEEQRRTLDSVIAPRGPVPADAGLLADLRGTIEAAIGGRTTPNGAWVGKDLLGALDRCDGLFVAKVLREGPPFAHSLKTAVGTVLHRAIQADIQKGKADGDEDAAAICWFAVAQLREARSDFDDFWRDSDEGVRGEVLREAERMLGVFRATFPPLRALRMQLKPAAEFKLKAVFANGNTEMTGYVDLGLGDAAKGQVTRVLFDHKTGNASAAQIEDLRFYALLHALDERTAAPPYRIATYLAEGGTFQVEDVTEETLRHAAERAGRAASRAIDVLDGDDARGLNPGPWCRWCPRAASCPQAQLDDVEEGAAPTGA